MAEISVRFEALDAGASGIRSVHSRLSSTLAQLEADLQPMIGSWSGAAQEAYLASKKQWDDAAAALALVLDGIGRAVGGAHDTYVATEAGARATWA